LGFTIYFKPIIKRIKPPQSANHFWYSELINKYSAPYSAINTQIMSPEMIPRDTAIPALNPDSMELLIK